MAENQQPLIGKDVIESLTLGMYEDCRFIYREYVQNAADQVDKAVAEGLMNKGEEHIQIEIDPENRSIIIEDNATGIAEANVVPILRNIAHSTKQRGVDKGFRGIGRLGGLGYCANLRFETSFKGEPVKSIMKWDAELLKFIINDRDNQEEAVEVLERVTETNTYKEREDAHYFRVVMEDVTSDDLLDVKSVTDYLSMVAPVDINSRFIFRSKIREYMKENNLSLDTYNIYINDTQIYKPYTNYIYEDNHGGKKQVDDILDVDFLMEKDENDEIIYWGWYSLSRLNGQMKPLNIARGIRLRKSNIQIGDEEICKKFFTKTEDAILVEVPDLEILTEGKDMNDAIDMARDAIELKCVSMEDAKENIPEPSDINKLHIEKGTFAEEGTTVISFVDVNPSEYRRKIDTKTVRRNVALPSWLNYEAEQAGVNVSRILQEALLSTLKLERRL